MNDEVKLILTKLKIVSEEKENGAYICDKEHSKLLLSYIEQLEKENEKANKYIDFYKDLTEKQNKSLEEIKQENKQLENNRDKAIEFINSEEFNTLTINKRKKLNDILKGDSDE